MQISLTRLFTLLALVTFAPCQANDPNPMLESTANRLGKEAAIYAYPLVMMDIAQNLATYTTHPEDYKAPINQFAHARSYPTTSFRQSAHPNVDTLSSNAWLDLSDGPIVLHIPSIPERYYVMDLVDAWTNVIGSIGPRTTGTAAQDFLICGPGFTDEVPTNMIKMPSGTNTVWIRGRTQCYGPDDFSAVNQIQDQFTLTPLASVGQDYTPPTTVALPSSRPSFEPAREQINDMQAAYYFDRFSNLLQNDPPSSQDTAVVEKLGQLGIAVGKKFYTQGASPAIERGLKTAFKEAKERIESNVRTTASVLNYWNMCTTNVGNYGTDYLLRASTAYLLLGANNPKDIIYAYTDSDYNGNWLTGGKNYVVHFSANAIPPVNAFWSVTLYNDVGCLVTTAVNNQAIRSFDEWLVTNDDGSIDILIQQEPPKNENSNWLMAPTGKFNLVLRLYWPQDQALNGSWIPPMVKCLHDD